MGGKCPFFTSTLQYVNAPAPVRRHGPFPTGPLRGFGGDELCLNVSKIRIPSPPARDRYAFRAKRRDQYERRRSTSVRSDEICAPVGATLHVIVSRIALFADFVHRIRNALRNTRTRPPLKMMFTIIISRLVDSTRYQTRDSLMWG